MQYKKVLQLVKKHLSDDLRRYPWKGNKNRYAGHCYVASEACLYFLGSEWKPEFIRHEGSPHWYLRHRETGKVLDPTVGQFKTKPNYKKGRGKGFLTSKPSKRAEVLINRCKNG